MKIVCKEINQTGSELLVYVMDQTNRPIQGAIYTKNKVEDGVNNLKTQFNIDTVELMSYNEYLNQ